MSSLLLPVCSVVGAVAALVLLAVSACRSARDCEEWLQERHERALVRDEPCVSVDAELVGAEAEAFLAGVR